jgi:small conductance mechanosensitive channel
LIWGIIALPAITDVTVLSLAIIALELPVLMLSPTIIPGASNLGELLRDWRADAINFLRHDAPAIVFILLLAFIVIRVFRTIIQETVAFQSKRLSHAVRLQQIQTLAGVLNSVGVFVVIFLAILMILSRLGLNLGPLLASAGVAGLAIGFGAQTLVKDVINGFFILMENQYDIGDVIRIAGVKGTVEAMSMRTTTLRDDDGTVHIVPNSDIQIVSNTTRDWSQFTMRVVVAFEEPSDRVLQLLKEVTDEIKHDPAYVDDIVGEIQMPGIDRVGNGEAEYLVIVKTRPTRQYPVSRELRRRIKESFIKNNIRAGTPGRVYVVEGPTAHAS